MPISRIIRGGHTFLTIRTGPEKVTNMGDRADSLASFATGVPLLRENKSNPEPDFSTPIAGEFD
jgi:hypothetical protein